MTEARTGQQNKALHLWLTQKAEQCRAAGVSPKQAFAKTIDLEMTPEMMKEIWRTVQKALFNTESTRDVVKEGQIEEVAEHLNRFFAQEEFGLEGISFPSQELKFWDQQPLQD